VARAKFLSGYKRADKLTVPARKAVKHNIEIQYLLKHLILKTASQRYLLLPHSQSQFSMASSAAAIEPLLDTTMRVLRSVTKADDLIAAWPSLKEKSLSSPATMTEHERRLYLDLPDEDMERSNIKRATSLSREQLIEKALSNWEQLTTREVDLLMGRFWTPIMPGENQLFLDAMMRTSEEAQDEFYEGRSLPQALNENAAFDIGVQEHCDRIRTTDIDRVQAAADLALPDAPEWVQCLYRQGKPRWGYVCLWDVASQKLDLRQLEEFKDRLLFALEDALRFNG